MPTRPYHALREREAAFVGVCVVLAVAVLPGAVFRGEVLSQAQLLFGYAPWQGHAPAGLPPVNTFLVDPPLVFYPFLAFATDAVRHGHLPTWSAGLYAGHPFLASFQSAVCSPFMPIAYLLPLPWATVPLALAPLVVGAAGMRRFVRALGSGESASWYAGLAWLLNGFAIVWLEHPLTAVACWLPWILLAVDRIVDHPSPGRAAWLAAAVGASILSGHPETSLKILLFAFAWGVHRGWGAPRRTWALLAGAGVAGVLLAAVQVVPFAEYLRLSEALARRNMAAGNTFVLPPATLVTAIVPDFFGNPAFGPYLARVNRFGIAANYGEQQVYAGAVTALLAPVGLVAAWRDGRSRFFAGAAVVALSLMYGLPGLLDLVSHLPVLRVSILSRFGVVVIASAIVLAARGVDALTGDPRRVAGVPTTDPLRRALVATFGILGVIVVLACGWFGSALAGVNLLARTRHASMVSIAFVAAAALVAWSRLRGRVGSRTCAVALCGLVTVELLAQAQGFHRTIARRDVLPSVPAIDAVRRDTSLHSACTDGGLPSCPTRRWHTGCRMREGGTACSPRGTRGLLDLGYLRQSRDPERHLANPVLLNLLNVKYSLRAGGPAAGRPAVRPRGRHRRCRLREHARAAARVARVTVCGHGRPHGRKRASRRPPRPAKSRAARG